MFRDQHRNVSPGRHDRKEMMHRPLMWRLLSENLPRLPFWWKQLDGIMSAGTIDLARAVEFVAYDPAFCAEFGRICRLAELPSAEDRLDNYLVWLGKERTRVVMIGAFLTSYLAAQTGSVLKEFACKIERLASMTYRLALSSTEINPQEAYVAGLVHHAGTLPLLHTIDPAGQLSPAWLDFSLESLTAQWLLFGTDTIELGHAMALLWDYPVALRESLRVSQDAAGDTPETPLAYVVRAADQLCAAGLQLPATYLSVPPVPLEESSLTPKRSNVLRFIPSDR